MFQSPAGHDCLSFLSSLVAYLETESTIHWKKRRKVTSRMFAEYINAIGFPRLEVLSNAENRDSGAFVFDFPLQLVSTPTIPPQPCSIAQASPISSESAKEKEDPGSIFPSSSSLRSRRCTWSGSLLAKSFRVP